MNKKYKCVFCGVEIEDFNLRCSKCNQIWNNGFKCGENEIKEQLRYLWTDVKNLIDERGVKK